MVAAAETVTMTLVVVKELFKAVGPTNRLARDLIIERLTKPQVKEFLNAGLFSGQEIENLKILYPTLFKLNNEEVFRLSCKNRAENHKIMRVKNLTREQFDKWFDSWFNKRHGTVFLSWKLAKWVLKQGLNKEQIKQLCELASIELDKEEDLFIYAESLGYEFSTREKYKLYCSAGRYSNSNVEVPFKYPMGDVLKCYIDEFLGDAPIDKETKELEELLPIHMIRAENIAKRYEFEGSVLKKVFSEIAFGQIEYARTITLDLVQSGKISMEFLVRNRLDEILGLSNSEKLVNNL